MGVDLYKVPTLAKAKPGLSPKDRRRFTKEGSPQAMLKMPKKVKRG